MSLCVKCGTAFVNRPEDTSPENQVCLWCERDALKAALELAVNSVECASVDPVTKEELPWYQAAKKALDKASPENK